MSSKGNIVGKNRLLVFNYGCWLAAGFAIHLGTALQLHVRLALAGCATPTCKTHVVIHRARPMRLVVGLVRILVLPHAADSFEDDKDVFAIPVFVFHQADLLLVLIEVQATSEQQLLAVEGLVASPSVGVVVISHLGNPLHDRCEYQARDRPGIW